MIGHGSHVAGIAAGNYGASSLLAPFPGALLSGMAPRARIAAYKVGQCAGCTFSGPRENKGLAQTVQSLNAQFQHGRGVPCHSGSTGASM
jgi:subtilisin family serine protease